jgi:hypothetical protein
MPSQYTVLYPFLSRFIDYCAGPCSTTVTAISLGELSTPMPSNAQISSTDHEVWIRGRGMIARGTELMKSDHPEAGNALGNKIPWQ